MSKKESEISDAVARATADLVTVTEYWLLLKTSKGDCVARITPEEGIWHGVIYLERDVVDFWAEKPDDFKVEMLRSLNVYGLECEMQGIEPARPQTGPFVFLATPPKLWIR